MNSFQKIDTVVFIYHYLRNLYDLPYHQSLGDENIIWGFNSVDKQTCLVNIANFGNPDTDVEEIFDEIKNRRTGNIKLITNIYYPKPKIWSELGFEFMRSKSVLKYNYPKNTSRKGISNFRSKLIENSAELTSLFKLNHRNVINDLKETLNNVILLVSRSLVTTEFIYKSNSKNPVGLFVIFPLKAFVIFEPILFSPEYLNENMLLQLVETVLRNRNLNNAMTLIITSQNWEHIRQDQITKVGEIQYYEKKKIKSPQLPIPICLKSAVLKTKSEFLNSIKIINSLGLPKHNDLPKNWDTLAALSQIVNSSLIEKSSAILDAGGEYYSVILYQLALYGYANLHCVNLAFTSSMKIGSITYQKGDITETTFEEKTFAAITCLSVIEHIVNIEKYFGEMSRILKDDGILFISTDYWKDTIDTQGKKSYGNPFKIYDSRGVNHMIDMAKEFKLELIAPVKLYCKNKVVSCDGFKYTFLYLTFKKKSGN